MAGKIYQVSTDAYLIKKAPAILKTNGVGSCIVVVFHNVKEKIGAMAHISRSNYEQTEPLSFLGLENMLNSILIEMDNLGCLRNFTRASLIGGANMFNMKIDELQDIGKINVNAAHNFLEANMIIIDKEEVLGSNSRSIVYHLETGLVEIKTQVR